MWVNLGTGMFTNGYTCQGSYALFSFFVVAIVVVVCVVGKGQSLVEYQYKFLASIVHLRSVLLQLNC